ncbi:MAG: antibiotic biosynthesis monooxygenase [Chloroflexi bacterium]|nr:antibiotic biosynthesis monooxygenase [Chloroflexota bacterium]
MSVTVVIGRRAQPGAGERLLRTARELFATRFARDASFRAARILQQLDDPDRFYFMAEWTSRAAYWASMGNDPAYSALDALSVEPATRGFFQRVSVIEDAGRCAELVRAILVDLVHSTAAVEIERRRALWPRLQRLPAFVFQHLHQDLENPRRLLFVYGWTDAPGMLAGHEHVKEWLGLPERRQGEMAITFQGYARLRLSRLPGQRSGVPA